MGGSDLRRIIEGAFPALWDALEAVLAFTLAVIPDDILNPPPDPYRPPPRLRKQPC